MNSIKFFQTSMGHAFYNGTMPELVKQIRKLNDHFEHYLATMSEVTPKENDRERKDKLVKRLVSYLEKEGMEGALDDLVHDSASILGSSINNAGPEEQIRFLIKESGLKWAEEVLAPIEEDLA